MTCPSAGSTGSLESVVSSTVGSGGSAMVVVAGDYPLVMSNSLLLKMAIEIVDFPMKNGGSFHSYGTVDQRVIMAKWGLTGMMVKIRGIIPK